jgi:hypothetical protein
MTRDRCQGVEVHDYPRTYRAARRIQPLGDFGNPPKPVTSPSHRERYTLQAPGRS